MITGSPLVSIIIPAYNSGKYIGKCLDSISAQSYKLLEVIIVNNNSSDDTLEICEEFAERDERFVVIDEKKKGVAFARNTGLDYMHGDYFFFLDSDDYITPDCIKILLNAAIANDTAMNIGNYFYDLHDKSSTYYNENRILTGEEFLKDALCRKFALNPCWGILYESKKYGNMRFQNYRMCEDELYLIMQLCDTDRISFVSDCLLIYRDNRSSVTTSGKYEVYLDGIKANELIFSYIEEHKPEYLPYARCNLLTIVFFAYFNLKRMRCSRDILSGVSRLIRRNRAKVMFCREASVKVRLTCLLSYAGMSLTSFVFRIYQFCFSLFDRIEITEGTKEVKACSTRISVIVPVYNVERHVRKCIDSILEQTHKNLEILLIDDGSTDASPAICDEYARADNRVRVIHQENQGLSAARNAGIDICTGDYICFVDSDDYIHPSFVSALLSDIIDSDADIAMCRFRKVLCEDVDEVINSTSHSGKRDRRGKTNILTSEMALKALMDSDSVGLLVAWNKLYSRAVFRTLRFPVGKLCEDNYFSYEAIANAEKICANDEVLYYYTQNPDGITHRRDDLSIYETEALDYYDFLIGKKITDSDELRQLRVKSVLKRLNMVVEDYYSAYKNRNKKRMAETIMLFDQICADFSGRSIQLNHKLRLFKNSRRIFIIERRIIEIVGKFRIRHNLYR